MKNGEIWLVNFTLSIGDEITKIRPSIIVNNDNIIGLDLKIVVPITSNRTPQDWHVKITPTKQNGLHKSTVADCNQVKSIANQRFVKKLGVLSTSDMDRVKWALARVLDLI